jgi:biopolymer transport protein ExbD
MGRAILYPGVATIAFVIGTAVSWSTNIFGGFVVDKFYSDAAFDVKACAIVPSAGFATFPPHSCGLVVSVTADGSLSLNTMPMGTLNDTTALTSTLRTAFQRREEMHVYLPSPELSSSVHPYCQIERAVSIKASRNLSYGEVADLIAIVREAGADPVGLVADCCNRQP